MLKSAVRIVMTPFALWFYWFQVIRCARVRLTDVVPKEVLRLEVVAADKHAVGYSFPNAKLCLPYFPACRLTGECVETRFSNNSTLVALRYATHFPALQCTPMLFSSSLTVPAAVVSYVWVLRGPHVVRNTRLTRRRRNKTPALPAGRWGCTQESPLS